MTLLNRLFYYGFVIPLSWLPFRVLYVISDGLYYILYHVVGYRKRVVFENIRNSFPEKTEQERTAIAKTFYKHFCDLILESLKTFSISKEGVDERMKVLHAEVPNRYFEQGRSIVIAGGHYNNWEIFAVAVDHAIKHQAMAIYKPLTNAYFDKKMQMTRSRYGLKLIHNRKVKENFDAEKDNLTATIFAVDQSPSFHSKPYWTQFLNQDTAVLTGTEKYAKDYDYPVVFCRISKVSRGHYTFEFEDLVEHPRDTKEGEITELVTRVLEKDIRDNPPYWLWSHRRWKQKRTAETNGASVN
ncbi:MAG: lysophospholipid acyltransferase family protein [Bacteroidota bacterium]